MKPKDNIEKMLKKMNVTPNDNRYNNTLNEVLAAHQNFKRSTPANTQPNIWRIIMKTKLTKLTTAAVIILIAVLALTFLDKTATTAWAIEETIELLKDFNGIHFLGTTLDKDNQEVALEGWARANEEQTASNYLRLETATGQIVVVAETTCYKYDPNTNIVKITEGYGPALSPWPGAQFLESLKEMVVDWNEIYGKDPATDRDRVFVTCSHPAAPGPRSWWLEFDIESKLLVSFKQWENMTQQGTPKFYIKSITFFEDLPDELFDFEIPEGAKTVDGLTERMDKLQNPNSGMLVENMTEEQACEKITRRYWQAIIDHDWQTVALLHPTATAQQWQDKYSTNNLEEIIEMKNSYQADGCTIVPCTIRFDSNVTRTINTAVFFREIDDQKSCVIANTWPEDTDTK